MKQEKKLQGKVGIMGGTFDPIHIGHLILAEQACAQFKLDRILFMPTSHPPHKDGQAVTEAALRRDMDTFHHMNNLHYLELAREALPEEAASQSFANIEILYRRQIRRGDRVRFLYSLRDGKHQVEIVDDQGRKTHALIWFS